MKAVAFRAKLGSLQPWSMLDDWLPMTYSIFSCVAFVRLQVWQSLKVYFCAFLCICVFGLAVSPSPWKGLMWELMGTQFEALFQQRNHEQGLGFKKNKGFFISAEEDGRSKVPTLLGFDQAWRVSHSHSMIVTVPFVPGASYFSLILLQAAWNKSFYYVLFIFNSWLACCLICGAYSQREFVHGTLHPKNSDPQDMEEIGHFFLFSICSAGTTNGMCDSFVSRWFLHASIFHLFSIFSISPKLATNETHDLYRSCQLGLSKFSA